MQFLPRHLSLTLTDSDEGMTVSMKNSNLPEATMLRRNPSHWDKPPTESSVTAKHTLCLIPSLVADLWMKELRFCPLESLAAFPAMASGQATSALLAPVPLYTIYEDHEVLLSLTH
jgi:hypothetical protein